MTRTTLEFNSVFKKFRRGELHDSLRDLLPAIARRFFHRVTNNSLDTSEFWALNNVSFSVKEGEALGIIGNNGAGKSTILKLLTGVMQPTRGQINVYSRLSALIEIGAGFHPDLTGRENIFLNGTILGMKRQEIQKKFDDIVEFAGIEDFIDTPVKRYSSGMYARLGFSVAAHVDPEILVVDEVLSVGDYAFQNKCLAKMISIVHGGATVIFVSHNLKAVAELCSRCILLEKGKNIAEGRPGEVIQRYMDRAQENAASHEGKDVFISNILLSGTNTENLVFEPGQKIQIDIEISAKVQCERLSVSLICLDDNFYRIFDTSTERLTGSSFSLAAGEKRTISIALDLHLVRGTYHFGTYIYRYDIEKIYDQRLPAATIYMNSNKDARGVVNLYPEVVA